jgi:hypothetical protein
LGVRKEVMVESGTAGVARDGEVVMAEVDDRLVSAAAGYVEVRIWSCQDQSGARENLQV